MSILTDSIQNYIYSKTAAKAISNAEYIEKIELWANKTVWVKLAKGSKLISQKKFKQYFAESRKERSKNIRIIGQSKNGFLTTSQSDKTNAYQITLHKNHINCECKDWEIQKELGIKTPMCKHAYAVLHHLNISSLAEYLETQNHYQF